MIHDTTLEEGIKAELSLLERSVDCIGPTPLRRALDYHVMQMKALLAMFDEARYETDEAYASMICSLFPK